ncbi:D-Ala-D-Ala carboxypeptidase family metallohydrolase [Devosia sp. MC521]|uniref:YcbK family protein n=1 Tax=Devosia sp. MC521 TaxID=2759954 RepID=UPI0015FA90F3|nr:D-Ala-D-Ala carboxypeptidase family metallohydrolase [Devosia sp. MC521]MBJ6986953.1 DUF882 domain-containing protein [Devosia sp. MC521]QMW63977.1 DUF882 domain-containing protein [Devosia sp. MC521]
MAKVYRSWRDFPLGNWRWPNFKPEEIASNRFINGKNGPKEKAQLLVDERSMDMLQALRTMLRKPLIINSAYRTETYNAQIGGARNGYHPKGMAFDVSMANHDPEAFEAAAIEVGFRGIGHYPNSNFMHIDSRQSATVVRFKGTGKNNAWFPKSAGTFSGAEPPKETLKDIITKPEVLTGAGGVLTGAGAITQGNGPFQLALGIALVVVVCAFVAWLIAKQFTGQREV